MEGRRGCREARTVRKARARKRGAVASLVAAAFMVLIAGLWSSGQTGDWKLGVAGIGLAVVVLWVANGMEGSKHG